MCADIDEHAARLQVLDNGTRQSLLEEAVLVELATDEVRQVHVHVTAKEGAGGDGPRSSCRSEQSRQQQPYGQPQQPLRARRSRERRLPAQTLQQRIAAKLVHEGPLPDSFERSEERRI